MSDQLQVQKNAAPIMTEAQKTEYTESLKTRYLEEGGIAKSRQLHDSIYKGNKRAFETNLLDVISLKENENAGFIQRAKEAIANRDQYAYADQVERSVNKFLDSESFSEGVVTDKFYVNEELNEKQKKTRYKEIIKEVNTHGIESFDNISDIISWMEAHIAIKGDDKGQFTRILDTLRGVQIQFGMNATKEDMLLRVNDLSLALNNYLQGHSKKPYTAKGKERVAICQTLMALTGTMYLEAEKANIKNKLDHERQETLNEYDEDWCESYPIKKPEELSSRRDMKEWIIAQGGSLASSDIRELRDHFLDFYHLIEFPYEEISGPDSIIRAARTFKNKALAFINSEFGFAKEEIKVLVKEADRVVSCLSWSKENGGAYYRECLEENGYTPAVLDYLKLVNSPKNLPDDYIKSLDDKALKEMNSILTADEKKNKDTTEKKELLKDALENEEINNLVDKLRINTDLVKKANGRYESRSVNDNLMLKGFRLNEQAKSCILSIYINKNDEEAYKESANKFLKQVLGNMFMALDSITYTDNMESFEWYMKNADKVEQMCNYAEAIESIKQNEELSKVYNMFDEKKKKSLEVHAEFWMAYRQRLAEYLYWQKAIKHPGMEISVLNNQKETDEKFKEKRKALYENEKDNEEKTLHRAKYGFRSKVISCFSEIKSEKSKIPRELMDDYTQLEGVMNLISNANALNPSKMGVILALMEKIGPKLKIKSVDTIIEACKTYGEAITGESKTKFEKEYNNFVNPKQYFDLSEDFITKATKKIDSITELSRMQRMFYDLPLEGGGNDEVEYVNSINECNKIVLELMQDKEVLRFYCQNTPDIFEYIQRSDINFAYAISGDIEEYAMTKKWLDNPEKYGFKESGGPDDLTVAKLTELREAQRLKYFHAYVCKCYMRVLEQFTVAVESGKYNGSIENQQKYKGYLGKLKAKYDALGKLGQRPTGFMTDALDRIQHHKDFIPEPGTKKSSHIKEYKGVEATYIDVYQKQEQ